MTLTEDEIKRFNELTKQSMLKSISELEFNSFGTSTKEEQTSFTLDNLQKAIDLLYPILYYGQSEFATKGSLYLVKKYDIYPEYILIHPDDFQEVKKLIKGRRLVSIKEYDFSHALFAKITDIKYHGG